MEQKQYTIGVFLDLSKAFDTVDHDILISKMSLCGVSEKGVKWFASYLTGRRQYVEVNNVVSEILPIACRVPQGSILGQLLFLL